MSVYKSEVDFLVIGAQKSGTTALFRYMQGHPELYMPPQKEINFFANEDRFQRGLGWYVGTYFEGADERKLWGEVSPHYMSYGRAPRRIHDAFPHAKLIALLRNPIDRAYSHYRMAVRRGQERRTFGEVITDQRRTLSTLPETETGDDSDYVLAFSRYGLALESYLRYFDREQLLVIFQEDILSRPEENLREVFSFLGVSEAYVPPNLGKKYHVGGVKRFEALERWVENRKTIKRMVKATVGSKNVEAARFWFQQMNVKPLEDQGPSVEDRQLLRETLSEDVDLLQWLFISSAPWPEFERSGKG